MVEADVRITVSCTEPIGKASGLWDLFRDSWSGSKFMDHDHKVLEMKLFMELKDIPTLIDSIKELIGHGGQIEGVIRFEA